MSIIFRVLGAILLLLVAGIGAVAFMIVEDEALVTGSGALSSSDLQEVRRFLETTDPRKLPPGTISEFTVREQDLELLLNYLLENIHGGRSRVDMTQGLARIEFSAALPENFPGRYLNVQLAMAQSSDVLVLQDLRMGRLHIPGWLADAVMKFAHAELKKGIPEYVALLDSIDEYSIRNDEVNVIYQWQPDLLEQISSRGRDLLVSEDDKERLMAHARKLSELTRDPELPATVSIAELMGPMFRFASSRQGDPVEENRAAIVAMAMHIMDIDVPEVLGEPAGSIAPMGQHQLRLSGRQDFAQHFLISAGLAISAGNGIAGSIGLLKEMEDSQGGSGFSFTDIGADRTGVRFAELAVATTEQARAVQAMFATEVSEALFMPDFKDLPEFMPEASFRETYGGVGEPAYNSVMEDIEARISRMPLFMKLE